MNLLGFLQAKQGASRYFIGVIVFSKVLEKIFVKFMGKLRKTVAQVVRFIRLLFEPKQINLFVREDN